MASTSTQQIVTGGGTATGRAEVSVGAQVTHGDRLTLRVITPERIVLDQAVSAVRIPGLDGSIGILPRHAPMVAALDAGLLSYRSAGADRTLFVSGGFAEVRDNTVRVVTEAGEKPAEIDEERARAAEARARARLDAARTDGGEPIDLLRAEAALRRALLRLSARGTREV